MRRRSVRLCFSVVAVLTLGLSATPPVAAAPPPSKDEKSNNAKSTGPIRHQLEHTLSIEGAAAEANNSSTPVIGFGYTNPTVSGAYFPTSTYPLETFLSDFKEEHGTVPEVDAFYTRPGTVKDLAAARGAVVKVKGPKFTAPAAPQSGSKTQLSCSSAVGLNQNM